VKTKLKVVRLVAWYSTVGSTVMSVMKSDKKS